MKDRKRKYIGRLFGFDVDRFLDALGDPLLVCMKARRDEPIPIDSVNDAPKGHLIGISIPSDVVVYDVDDESKVPEDALEIIKQAGIVVKTPRGAHCYFDCRGEPNELWCAPDTILSMFTTSSRYSVDYNDDTKDGNCLPHIRSMDRLTTPRLAFIPPTKGYKIIKLNKLTKWPEI